MTNHAITDKELTTVTMFTVTQQIPVTVTIPAGTAVYRAPDGEVKIEVREPMLPGSVPTTMLLTLQEAARRGMVRAVAGSTLHNAGISQQ